MARIRRFPICTGCSFAPKRRALQPSMKRLANASSRSTRLYDLRADQDDDRCEVDPGKKARGEGEWAIRREQAERAGEVAERQLGDLPQQGRYQSGSGHHATAYPPAWKRAVDQREEHVA